MKCILLYRARDADRYCSIDDDISSKRLSRVQTFQPRERRPAPLQGTRCPHSCSFSPPDLRQKPLPPPPDTSQKPLPSPSDISQKPLPPPPEQEKPKFARRPTSDPMPATLPLPPVPPRQSSPATRGRFPGLSSDSPGLTTQRLEGVINQLQKAVVNPTGKRGNIFLLRWKEKANWKFDSNLFNSRILNVTTAILLLRDSKHWSIRDRR